MWSSRIPGLWRLRGLSRRLAPARALLHARHALRDRIVFIDVGASAGIQDKWLPYAASILPVLFEPNPAEAAKLRAELSHFGAKVIEFGLSDRAGPQTLHIGTYFGCTSVLRTNPAFLDDYAIAPLYVPTTDVQIECVRYDSLVAQGDAPLPDVIKIDIEGYESVALAGFGDLLGGILGIEVEAWLYPVFTGQALLHDLVAMLDGHGLRLRRIEQVPGFEGDLVVVNAFFSCSARRYEGLTPARKAKYDLMAKVMRLPSRKQ